MIGHSLVSIVHHPPLELVSDPGVVGFERPNREIHRFEEQGLSQTAPAHDQICAATMPVSALQSRLH